MKISKQHFLFCIFPEYFVTKYILKFSKGNEEVLANEGAKSTGIPWHLWNIHGVARHRPDDGTWARDHAVRSEYQKLKGDEFSSVHRAIICFIAGNNLSSSQLTPVHMLFERCHTKNRKRSIKKNMKYFHFRCQVQLDQPTWHSIKSL